MRRRWILILALFSPATPAQLAFVPSNSDSSQVCFKLGERVVKVPCEPGANPLSWSTDGRWLVLGERLEGGHYKLSLVDTRAEEPRVRTIDGECSAPSWAPDGKRFVYESVGKGILIRDVGGKRTDTMALLPKGKSPSWSPHGGRIATMPVGADNGVILCDVEGHHLRRVFTELKATRLAWAPDGLRLAVVSAGSIWMLSISGRESERLCGADDAHLEFSPDGAHLLCQVEGAWGTVDLSTKEWTPLPVEFSCTPTWQNSHEIIGLSQEHFVDLGVGHPARDPDPLDLDLPISAFALGHAAGVTKNPRAEPSRKIAKTGAKATKTEPPPAAKSTTLASRGGATPGRRTLEYDGVSRATVVVPMLFPVCGKVSWLDTFLTSRDGGGRRHHGQDLMAPKMRPLVAAFDGVVRLSKSKSHNMITLKGDNGWSVTYMHVNNDTPGTEDSAGSDLYAFAPGLRTGDRVVRGQLVGFCGNSGNAKGGAAHCHFELNDDVAGGVLNALASLQAAPHLDEPITIDPCPALKPSEGEERWDIVVTSADLTQNQIVGELIAKTVDGALKVNLMPQKVILKLETETKIWLRNTPGEARRSDDIKSGMYLSAIGLTPQPGRVLEAKAVAVSLTSHE